MGDVLPFPPRLGTDGDDAVVDCEREAQLEALAVDRLAELALERYLLGFIDDAESPA